MWPIILFIWNWFGTHEWLAIWLEGIALVAIFIWDRVDAKSSHKEMLEQIAIAKEQAEAARLGAQSVVNSERAWILAELDWYVGGLRQATTTSVNRGVEKSATSVDVLLKIRNEGRSPAWIDDVRTSFEIMAEDHSIGPNIEPESEVIEDLRGPLGAGKVWERKLTLTCEGQVRSGEYLAIFMLIEYRDIFDHKRKTAIGYSIDANNKLQPLTSLSERTKNT